MKKMPIRNKSKDNPYTLYFDDKKENYIVEFTDNKKLRHKVEISMDVYVAFDKFELEDISQIHKFRKHIEHSEIFEETLNRRCLNKPLSLEEVEQKLLLEEIREAFNILTETQKRRFKMYYYDDLNFKQIAVKERCDESSVRESIYKGIEKIKKSLK